MNRMSVMLTAWNKIADDLSSSVSEASGEVMVSETVATPQQQHVTSCLHEVSH